jgi:hypothetical protein
MTTRENMGISLLLSAVGRSVGIEPRSAATEPNKINGFVHKSYGTAVKLEKESAKHIHVTLIAAVDISNRLRYNLTIF